ncbi:hypothetical protein KY285_029964 [Solanum tuberosum]|nr:hypothetical protein KY285_029964 [Solanum tuberosum]
MSTSSLHQLIVTCSVKLKQANYLIWRIQISQLIQVARKVVVVEKDAKDSDNIDDKKRKTCC